MTACCRGREGGSSLTAERDHGRVLPTMYNQTYQPRHAKFMCLPHVGMPGKRCEGKHWALTCQTASRFIPVWPSSGASSPGSGGPPGPGRTKAPGSKSSAPSAPAAGTPGSPQLPAPKWGPPVNTKPHNHNPQDYTPFKGKPSGHT